MNYKYGFGTFVERPNRFIAHIKYEEKLLRCHVPDPGRLKELLMPDRKVLLRFSQNQISQKTDGTVVGVFEPLSKIWVSLDSQLANRFIKNLWYNLPFFCNYEEISSEYSYGKSRLDFLLTRDTKKCLVEVKTATLVKGGIALFPDAPTKRGVRHVKELIKAKQSKFEALITFVVPRSDAIEIRPNKEIDPVFYNTMKEAINEDIKVQALKCDFNPNGLLYKEEIPFALQ